MTFCSVLDCLSKSLSLDPQLGSMGPSLTVTVPQLCPLSHGKLLLSGSDQDHFLTFGSQWAMEWAGTVSVPSRGCVPSASPGPGSVGCSLCLSGK